MKSSETLSLSSAASSADRVHYSKSYRMNIIVKPYGSALCSCRPDTTWERENRDFYSPECVNEIYWTPVVFARISKAGKCVSGKFVERYYDGFNFGVLMYCAIDGAISAFVDHTSILPHPLYNPVVLEGENVFEVIKNGEKAEFGAVAMSEAKDLLQAAICNASQLTSLRIGDFVAVELAPQQLLASRTDGETALSGRFCENEIFNYMIIF